MSVSSCIREFENPSSEFSPMPFWFWNDELSEKEISRQIFEFHEKGVDGFVIHPRIGLPESIGYMSGSWLHYVEFAVTEAGKLGMHVILYDEAMYPSGSCHGEVVRCNPQFASKCLEMRESPDHAPDENLVMQIERDGKPYYLFECFSGGTIRGVHFGEDDGEPGAPRSADLLNFDAVACFIRLTHEKYYQALKKYFGNTIIGIFTDEPMICGRGPAKIPWTTGFSQVLQDSGFPAEDLYDLFVKKDPEKSRRVQKAHDRLIRQRLQDSFYRQIAEWCRAHGIAFLGHPQKSTDIELLTNFDIPCQDIVWRYVAPGNGSGVAGPHSTMAKCASDSARHRNKRRNGNECFGCCGHEDDPYAFTREDMKWYLDWLFVRGCNLIVPHAFFYSLRGKRKEERPPDVGMNSAFWPEYHRISDYIKRCCAINTDSVNVTDIAVLCGEDDLPYRAAKELYESQIEFNYLEYGLLSRCDISDGTCRIAGNRYKILVVDGCRDEEAGPFFARFLDRGGMVIDSEKCGDLIRVLSENSDTVIDLDRRRDLRITHIRKYDTDILFCVNEGEEPVDTVIREKVTAVLDAERGTVTGFHQKEYPLHLAARESLHLILKK